MKRLLVLILVTTNLLACAQKHAYSIVKTFHIQSSGGWDYIAVHEGKIYVSHSTQVNILDEATGDSVGVILNTDGVHGIAFDNVLKRGYTSNGRSNTVTVFNSMNHKVIDLIHTGENPDAILYDPFTNTIITCNGRSKDLSLIDPNTNKVVHTIALGGKPEMAVSDGVGNLYVNLEDLNEIAQVNLKNFTVVDHWALEGGVNPTGLAYDPATKRLFSGCKKKLIIVNATNGKIVNKLPIGEGCDGVVFDNLKKLIFTSNGVGVLTVIKEENADHFTLEGNYPTKRGARTIAINEKKGTVYLPTANFESGQTQNGRPEMIPGTFQVLVIR